MDEVRALEEAFGRRALFEIHARAKEEANHLRASQVKLGLAGYGDPVVSQAIQERGEAQALAHLFEVQRRAIETTGLEDRIERLERAKSLP